MNKFLFLMVLIGLASVASIGILAPDFDVIVQKLGVFHTEDVNLVGCDCVLEGGGTTDCGLFIDSLELCTPTPP